MTGGVVGWFIIRPVNAVLGWFFRGFNAASTGSPAVYGWSVGKLLRVSVVVLLVYGGLLVLTYCVFTAPTGFIPQQDQGRLIVSIQLPDSASLERTEAGGDQVEKIATRTPGVAHTVAIVGHVVPVAGQQLRTSPRCSSCSDPFDERQTPELTRHGHHGQAAQGVGAAGPGAAVMVVRGVADAGPGRRRRLQVHGRGPRRAGAARPCRPRPTAWSAKLQENAGAATASPPSSAPTRRSSSWTSTATKAASLGVSLDDVNQTLDMFLGSLYVNSFNEFGRHWQVTVQADERVTAIASRTSTCSQVRNNRARWCRWARWSAPREIGGPIAVTRYNLYTVRGGQRQHAARATAPATPSTPSTTTADETLPLSMKTDWTELMFLQIRAGNTGMYVFALAVLCVFLALSALYESWSLPLAVILVVPLCLLCSLAGVLLHGPRREHLRADRPGGAGGAGLQERHPDRRVRQAACTCEGQIALRRPRRRPRGCGCGRS